ncbi:MAG: carbamoyltransferase HypF [Planctomycetota bacterium]
MPEATVSSVHGARGVRAEVLLVTGVVQGVGFRPHAHRLATSLGLAGTVANGPDGVEVFVQGDPAALDAFARGIVDRAPHAAVVDRLQRTSTETRSVTDFRVVESIASLDRGLSIGPDLATCDACLAELFDPNDRRYRYPFLNCTNCGPRYTIAVDLPYDRPNTTMASFEMCAECHDEYGDPSDRRFHAQPTACPDCGPTLAWHDQSASMDGVVGEDALQAAVAALREGRIVAVQGIGGFHLMVRADDTAAIGRLRERKKRGDKPFAVLFRNVDDVRERLGEGILQDVEAELLASPAAPIVLVRARRARGVSRAVAPASPDLGCFVASNPLHHLLLADLGRPVVATSGNRRDEPIAIGPEEARERLAGIADAFLVHDRPIVRPVDDSIVRVIAGRPTVLRRARGYAPLAFDWDALPETGVDLALGAHQKATVGLRVGQRVVLSPHIGDLESLPARAFHERAARDLQELVGRRAERVVCDRHPDYASTQLAERWVPSPIRVQHHAAHVWAAALEHDLDGPFFAAAWDGTGLGDDGTIWGGEFFARDGEVPRRVGSFEPFALPGGERAVREPWRAALGLLETAYAGDPPAALTKALRSYADEGPPNAYELVRGVVRAGAPMTSSVGRLFDAVAALLGVSGRVCFEAEAAQRLEAIAFEAGPAPPYPFTVQSADPSEPWRVPSRDWLEAMAEDLEAGSDASFIAARFHETLARVVTACAARAGEKSVVLTGGCFQNRVLLERAAELLREDGRRPLWPRRIPCGDGGVAVGQLVSAALDPTQYQS